MTAKIIKFPVLERIPVATCPECRNQSWYIHVDDVFDFHNVTAHECDQCGFTVDIHAEFVNVD